MNLIKKVPLPITGVALGFAALGNLLQSYSEGVRYACGIISAILLLLFVIKVIAYSKTFKEDMNNPITASVFGTFPMALMLLSVYVKPCIGQAAFVLWIINVVLHALLIIYFTIKFVLKFDFKKVFASYFIVYVGIVVAAVTAPAYEMADSIGSICFWVGFVLYIPFLVLVTIRYAKYRDIPNPARPLFCIYAAPMSLCIAGYVQSVTPKNKVFLLAMFAVSSIIFIIALVKAVTFLKLPFFPSYAAFTFPFVITAIAAKQTNACLTKLESPIAALGPVVIVETVIATVFVLYTLIRFLMFLFAKPAK